MTWPALAWPDPDPLVEAGEDSPFRRTQRAHRAAREIAADFRRLEGETAAQLLARLDRLKGELQARLAVALTGTETPAIESLIRQVDTLIADATVEILRGTTAPLRRAAVLGELAASHPVRALQVQITPALPGTDAALVAAAEDNTVDLLTPPMRQFATDIKTSLRRIATAGGQRMEEIQRLQQRIAGQGFDAAAYRAERIVRTELGRTFGEATYARMEALAQTFPFLKKAWTATKDRRTRLGHQQAAQTYARGKGIAIAERFAIPVYDERAKDGPKSLGVALLRFPVDPLATPAGRLAAASTILCRCHAVVDVDPAKFADFARVQVAMALGGPVPPAPPAPPPPVTPPAPKVARPPSSPRAPARPRIVRRRPAAQSVAQKLVIPADPQWDVARSAMNAVEQVHGDGPLKRLPLIVSPYSDVFGYVLNAEGVGTREMGLSGIGFTAHPHMTLWHETGHWLDFMGVAKGGAVHPGRRGGHLRPAPAARPGATRVSFSSAADLTNRMLDPWRAAVNGSAAAQTLQQWRRLPVTQRPTPVSSSWLSDAVTHEEFFARSYAQWLAEHAQHPVGLAELRREQGLPYPKQWTDADFRPIAAALDRLFELLGWRVSATIKP